MPHFASFLLGLSRARKRALVMGLDLLLLPLCIWVAFALRMSSFWPDQVPEFWWLFGAAPLVAIPIFARMGLYRAVIRYIGKRSIGVIVHAVSLHVLLLGSILIFVGLQGFPRSVLIIYWLLCLVVVGGSRFLGRAWLHHSLKAEQSPVRCLIFGAGEPGAELSHTLQEGWVYLPIAFVDDKRALQGNVVHGLKVYPSSQLEHLVSKHAIDEILLAIPSASRARRRDVLTRLEPLPVSIKSVPSMRDLVTGNAGVGELRDLDVEDLLDLLGREPIAPHDHLLSLAVEGKSVMVTGAGGSIGSELCRQIARLKPARLVLFEISEHALYQIHRELTAPTATTRGLEIVPVLGTISDARRASSLMSAMRVETVYHAAAYKHVPLVEHNPIAGIHNNVFGTWHLARAAERANVATFVLVSSDKAVRPTNVMGASKRMSELIVQALATRNTSTCFSIVRFGNVLGSSGSVVPLFNEQLLAGGPITVTDPRVVRYFMTIPEAAQLVIQAGALGRGGDVFVLNMGESKRIVDIAHRMVRLSGLRVRDNEHPDGDIAIDFTGLRAGEKLFEELLIGDEAVPTEHPLIMRAQEASLPLETVTEIVSGLRGACRRFDSGQVRSLLLKGVAGYAPQCEIHDPVWRDEPRPAVMVN